MRQIITVTNLESPELSVYAHLNEAQLLHYYEPHGGLFIAESPKVIERALNAGYEPVSLLLEEKHILGEGASVIARCGDIPIYTGHLELLKQITGFALTRGMLCAMKRKTLPTLAELCKDASRIAILENVVNPTNVGAIFRSAAAMNMDAVILTAGSADPLYRRASRVSMGTVFQVPWTILDAADWPETACKQLQEFGFSTAAMALSDDSVRIDDPCLASLDHLAIILGTEGDGLADHTIAGCDYTVRIPMSHNVDSLNVAAASAVAFWELGGRRL